MLRLLWQVGPGRCFSKSRGINVDEEYVKPQYMSYNAMARSPMVAGIPFMPFLMVGCFSMLASTFGGLWFGLVGWSFGSPGILILIFIRMLSATDDKAVQILLIELKWYFIKKMGGNSDLFNGAMHIAPMPYGRKLKDVKRLFDSVQIGQGSDYLRQGK